jgi:hypothetical protein
MVLAKTDLKRGGVGRGYQYERVEKYALCHEHVPTYNRFTAGEH